MHPFHSYTFVVPDSAIDGNGHASNIEFVRWTQDAAVDHATAVGCTAATQAAGCTWVVRSHSIDYLRPAFAGDWIEVRTWIADYRRAFSTRKYEFHRPADGALLARGETNWVYVDLASGRPRSIPAEIQALFFPPPGKR